MNSSCYGRRRMSPAVAMPTCYGRRTATDGICQMCESAVRDVECADMVLAMAYVLMQPWANLYEVEDGFNRGTIFADLDKPFAGGGIRCGL